MSAAAKTWVASVGAGSAEGLCGKAAWMVESMESKKLVEALRRQEDAAPPLRSGVYCKFSTLPAESSFLPPTIGGAKTWVYVTGGDAEVAEKWSALDARGKAVELRSEAGPHECVMGAFESGDYVEIVLPAVPGQEEPVVRRTGRIVERFDEAAATSSENGKNGHIEYEVKLDSDNVFHILPVYALIPAAERDPMDPCNKSTAGNEAAALGDEMQNKLLTDVNIAQTTVKAKTDICKVPAWQRFFQSTREGLLEIAIGRELNAKLESQNNMIVRDEIAAEVELLLKVKASDNVVAVVGTGSLVSQYKGLRKEQLRKREVLRSTTLREKIENTVAKYKSFLEETFEVTSKDRSVPEKEAGGADDPADKNPAVAAGTTTVSAAIMERFSAAPSCIAPPEPAAAAGGWGGCKKQPAAVAAAVQPSAKDDKSFMSKDGDKKNAKGAAVAAASAELYLTPILHTILKTFVDEKPHRDFLAGELQRRWREVNIDDLIRGAPFEFDYTGSSAPMSRKTYYDQCQDNHTHAKLREADPALDSAAKNAAKRLNKDAATVGACAKLLLTALSVEESKKLNWSPDTLKPIVEKHCPKMRQTDSDLHGLVAVVREARAETLQLSKNQESCRRAVRRQREMEQRREEFHKVYARQTTKIVAAEAAIAAESRATKVSPSKVEALKAKKKTLEAAQQRRAKEFGFAHVSAVARQVIRTLFEEVSKAEADMLPKKEKQEAGAAVLAAAKVVLAEKVEAFVQDAVHSLLNMGTPDAQEFLVELGKIAPGKQTASHASAYRHLYALLVADSRGEFFRKAAIELRRTDKSEEEKEQAVKSVALPSPFSLVPFLEKSDLKTVSIDKYDVGRSLSAQMQRKAVRTGVFVLDTGLGPESLKALNATGTKDQPKDTSKDPAPEKLLLPYREYSVLFHRTASETAYGAVIYARAAEHSWVEDVLQSWERVEVLGAQ